MATSDNPLPSLGFDMTSAVANSDNMTTASLIANLAYSDPVTTRSPDTTSLTCPERVLFVSIVVIPIVCILGLIGNTLSMVILAADRHNSATSVLLMALAVMDDVVLVTSLLRRPLPALCKLYDISERFCAVRASYLELVMRPTFHIAHMATTWTTVQVTLHRYIAVCHSVHMAKWGTVRVAYLQIAASLAFAFVFTSPRYFEYTVELDDDGMPSLEARSYETNATYKLIYKEMLYSIFIYALPLALLGFLTLSLCLAIAKRTKKRSEMTRSARDKQQITLALVSVVIVFVVCQLFNPVRRYVFWRNDRKNKMCSYHVLSQLTYFAIAFNSAVNFVLYCVFATRFRRRLLHLCGWTNKVEPEEPFNTAASQAPSNTDTTE